ncbi:TraG/TraD/VirD4 family protein [Porticoccaceae bacterium]|nr:TraG/TraD/VirD4 family protein [Porticoccaceae bacterium]
MTGSTAHRETIDYDSLVRDPRTFWQRFKDFSKSKFFSLTVVSSFLLFGLLLPGSFFICFFVSWLLYSRTRGVTLQLPFNLPIYSKAKDPSRVKPGTFREEFEDASGVGLLGYDLETREQIWTAVDKYLTHLCVMGKTGAGKTVLLQGHAFIFMMMGGGVTYNDAKGTVDLVREMYTLSRYFGLEDNFRALNYLTGDQSEARDPALRRSNDFNMFATGSHDALTQFTISLLGEVGKGENKVFQDQAMALTAALMPALVELREKELLHLNPGVLRRFMEFPVFTALAENPHISNSARSKLQAFVASLSGYKPKLTMEKQDPQVTKQFGFAQMFYQRALSLLTDTYGHIFMVGHPELDARDLVFKNRHCVTLLPSMEKSSGEMTSLATGVLASLRGAMSLGLGDQVEGSQAETIKSGLKSSNVPNLITNDEYAFMAVKDFAVTAAQARGIRFALMFGFQDYAGAKRADEKEAEQIIENSAIKQIMAMEMTGETQKLVQQLVGKKMVARSAGYERTGRGTNAYREKRELEYREEERITSHDIRGLNSGEAYIIVEDTLIKSQVFYHGFGKKDWVENFEIIRLLKIDPPKRGPGAALFIPGMSEAQEGTQQWVRNTTIDEVKGFISASKPPKRISSLINSVFDEQLDGSLVSKALSFVANFDSSKTRGGALPSTTEIDKIDATQKSGPLQNSSGNAFRYDGGDQDNNQERDSTRADQLPESHLDKDNAYDSEPTGHPENSSLMESLDDSGIESINNPEEYLPNKINSVAEGLSAEIKNIEDAACDAEISGGASSDVAQARAKQTGAIIAKSVLHPIPPNPPDDPDANIALVEDYVSQWLSGASEDEDA